MNFRARLQSLFWEYNRPLRASARRVRRTLSTRFHVLRGLFGHETPPRVVCDPTPTEDSAVSDPAITVVVAGGAPCDGEKEFLARQTEQSFELSSQSAPGAAFGFFPGRGVGRFPPTHLESMLMAACAENLDWVVAGWATPADGKTAPSGRIGVDSGTDSCSGSLVRLPHGGSCERRTVTGRALGNIRSSGSNCDVEATGEPFTSASGAYRLRHGVRFGSIVHSHVHAIDTALANLPAVEGPPTVLFLLPYLAVGGAEALLDTLVRNMRSSCRVLVVTTDPHVVKLGSTVDRMRSLTPHVYTLGDWLPAEAVASAIRHLIRRWRAQTLVCWNGNVYFYDIVDSVKKRFPSLRIVNQLYNHRGGWIEHYCPAVADSVDLHVAVNGAIARALEVERRVPTGKIATIHHGVDIPPTRTDDEKTTLRQHRREELGLPQDDLVVGTFIRMHPQKRPLDVLEVARRFVGKGVHFLLVGGGPLDEMINRRLDRDGLPNLTRLGMRDDALDLYDALDLCLMTSSFEGLPVFLLDGLAREIPCVAPAVGDIPLLLESGGGVVVEAPGDIDGLVAGIRTLMDPERRGLEGRLGRSRIEHRFGTERFVSDYQAAIFPER